MSAVAGILNLDFRPVDRGLLGRMLECVPEWGSDAVRLWSNDFVGLGHRQLCTTEESWREMQPASNRRHSCWITFDGRIDNRDDLIDLLKPVSNQTGSITDVELFLYAYDAWGTECLKR